jgi:predicted permease
MSAFLYPFRHALRRLAKAPAFTALVILTLGPGIGALIAIFSLVDVLFLRPLPLKDAGRLVGVYETRDGRGYFPLSLPDYADYRTENKAFTALASHYPTAPLILSSRDESVELNGSVVSANYFSVLGIEPAMGRFFLPEDDKPGGNPVAVVSHQLWQSHLGGRADVVGHVVRLNNTSFTVVGVAPERFTGVLLGIPSDVWLPNAMSAVGYRWCDTLIRDCTWLTMIGRLEPGRSVASAQSEMTVLSRGLREARPTSNEGRGLRVTPLRGVHPGARPDTLRLAVLLVAGVALGVAVAGANLSSLLLARSLTRRKEISVRLALGATRMQVVMQVVAEALLLTLAGGVAGAFVASLIGRVIVALYPSDIPLDLSLDLTVLGYAGLVSVLIGLLVGLVPGLQSTRPGLVTALKETVTAARHGRPRLLGFLIVVQVALSFVLLTSTGLLARSLAGAGRGGGLEASGVVTLRLRPRLIDYNAVQGQAFSREAVRRLQGLPGVRSVSLGAVMPPWLPGDPIPVELPGRKSGRPQDAPTAWVGRFGPRFFQTFGVPILRGRDFDDHDKTGAPLVAIVNQAIARRLWPHDGAVGQHLVVQDKEYEVVGLVPDVGYRNAMEPAAPQVYLSYWQNDKVIDARLCVRVAGDPLRLLPALRGELRAIDPNVPVTEVEPVTASLDRFLAPVRVAGRILGLSAGIALFLSTVGLFGVLSLAVTQRRRDIGIRMAIGSSQRRVVSLVVRDALMLVGTALAVGLVSALGASRLLAHYLYGVGPYDPLTFATALALLALTAGVASWLPARRASQIDPLSILRQG